MTNILGRGVIGMESASSDAFFGDSNESQKFSAYVFYKILRKVENVIDLVRELA